MIYEDNNYLAHYGVKGMKWDVRKKKTDAWKDEIARVKKRLDPDFRKRNSGPGLSKEEKKQLRKAKNDRRLDSAKYTVKKTAEKTEKFLDDNFPVVGMYSIRSPQNNYTYLSPSKNLSKNKKATEFIDKLNDKLYDQGLRKKKRKETLNNAKNKIKSALDEYKPTHNTEITTYTPKEFAESLKKDKKLRRSIERYQRKQKRKAKVESLLGIH